MKYFASLFASIAMVFFSTLTLAEAVYPYSNPTYIPNAVSAPATFAAPADPVFTLNGIGTLSVRVSGTCTSLAAVMQGSNDSGANYTAINMYPIATGTIAPVPVASISAAGFWKVNVTGFNKVRLHITALTASCTVAMVGTPGAFNGVSF